MFIGHFGVGLAAKKVDQKPSLGTLFFASQFIDLLWPILLIFGIEKVVIEPGSTAFTPLNFVYYPFTHSLIGVLIWGFLVGGVYYILKKNIRSAILIGALVVSHWILDFIVHSPDLPLVPGLDVKVGLGLWNTILGTLIFESAIFIIGVVIYYGITIAKNKKGEYGYWGLILFIAVIYISNIFGPPPPDVETIAWVGNLQWLFVFWAYWVDKNRETKTA